MVNYSFDKWRLQPTSPVTGETAGADLPITWENSRDAEIDVPYQVKGDYTISAFNVLNYFTSLGKDHNCGHYDDREGKPVTAKDCDVRGAYSEDAFRDQERKIVNAINGLDADVIALSEIENGYATTGDKSKRDNALNHLVDELNKAGGNWKAVASPKDLPVKGDAIRTAFIYDPDRVTPVGESRIFTDDRFTGTAREPLAQEFAPVTSPGQRDDAKESFVAVANHFKSKGSVAKGDKDAGDGQGNNPNVRNSQAQAVLDHLSKQEDWKDKATFVMGDLNTYTHETPLETFRTAGYTVPAEDFGASASYQFDGLPGSLDHVLANKVAAGKLQDAQVWDINSDEAVAFEYSRRHANVVDFYDDSPFRSSDHDPVKVGFRLDGADDSDGSDNANGSDNTNEQPGTDPDTKPGETPSETPGETPGDNQGGETPGNEPNDKPGSKPGTKPSLPSQSRNAKSVLSAALPLLGGLGIGAAILGLLPLSNNSDDAAHRAAVEHYVADSLKGRTPASFHGFIDGVARTVAQLSSGLSFWDFLRKN